MIASPKVKTDSIFYDIFQSYPSFFFELIGNTSPRSSTYNFVSQAVKQSRFEIDGIFIPPIYASDLPIYFAEFQGYRDRKKNLYSGFFAEIFLYLDDYTPVNDWRGIMIFTEKRLDPGLPLQYQDFKNSPRFTRIYLDELEPQVTDKSLGLSVIRLVGVRENIAAEQARILIERAKQQAPDLNFQRAIIELIETVIVYKFPDLGRKEIEDMLGLNDLKNTKVYQEALKEGEDRGEQRGEQQGEHKNKLAVAAKLLNRGMPIEDIAEITELEIEQVRQIANQK
ncbi:hypothetical protein NIES4071_92180 [Calothrix sp. NIES-4071]|nr:hypothetical protein NIES4071_92180 [Calothrix sp. NIES-4071]BAZ63485.1 hypothetical protein NIES4105_92110 [Calothrix sp. NIES-4105]